MKSVGLTVGNQLWAAPHLLFFGVLSPFSWPTYRWHEIICKHVCLPPSLPPWSSLSWVGHPASNWANLQTCLQSTSKSCLVKPMSEHTTPVLKTSNHFRGKSSELGPTGPFFSSSNPYCSTHCSLCSSHTGLLLKHTKYIWRDPRPSYPSFKSLLSLPLFVSLPDVF